MWYRTASLAVFECGINHYLSNVKIDRRQLVLEQYTLV